MGRRDCGCGLHLVEPNRAGSLVASVGMKAGDSYCSRFANAEEALAVADPSSDPMEMIARKEAESGRPFAHTLARW